MPLEAEYVFTEYHKTHSHLEIASSQHNVVHLFHRQECRLGNLVLNKCISLVLVSQVVVAEANVLHRAERQKRLLDSILVDVKVYTTNIDSKNKCSSAKMQQHVINLRSFSDKLRLYLFTFRNCFSFRATAMARSTECRETLRNSSGAVQKVYFEVIGFLITTILLPECSTKICNLEDELSSRCRMTTENINIQTIASAVMLTTNKSEVMTRKYPQQSTVEFVVVITDQ